LRYIIYDEQKNRQKWQKFFQRRAVWKRGIFIVINNFSKKSCIPCLDRNINLAFSNKSRSFAPLRTTPIYVPCREGAKLQAKKAIGFFSTMPGRLALVHPQSLNGLLSGSEGF